MVKNDKKQITLSDLRRMWKETLSEGRKTLSIRTIKKRGKTKMNNNEIKAKTFVEIEGKVNPETLSYTKIDTMYLLRFDLLTQTGNLEVKTLNKKIIGKFCQLIGLSYGKMLDDMGKEDSPVTVEQTEEFIRGAVRDADREIVVLKNDKGENVNFVSKRHKQLSMVDIHNMVQVVGVEAGAKPLGVTETTEGYKASFEVSNGTIGSMRVMVDYGRNDAQGRASIRFEGGGHIFVCSNMIVPYVHKSISTSANLEQFKHPKIIHTLGVDDVARARARQMFVEATEHAKVVLQKLEDSKLVPMSREVQLYALELIKTKHSISEKQMIEVISQLDKEEESLFGLSQALTWVGTRATAPSVKDTLCRVGGQVVLLGAGLVEIFKENFRQGNIPLPEIQVR